MTATVPPPPTTDFVVEVTPAIVEHFREYGFTSVERITTDDEIAWLREVYDDLFAAKQGGVAGGYFDLARPYDVAGDDLLPQLLFPEQTVPELADTAYIRNARRIAAALLDVPAPDLQHWGHMIRKPPETGHETPWHQDEAYWDPGLQFHAVGAWMSLDDTDETNGCMMFVPGSHRSDVLAHRHIGDDPAVHGLEFAVDVDVSSAVSVPLPAGGATFHHSRTYHATNANRSSRQRRAYANEFQTPPRPAERAHRPWVDAGVEARSRRQLD